MNAIESIQVLLVQAVRRRRWQNGWLGWWRGLWIGSLVLLATLAVYKLAPIPESSVFWAGLAGLACALGGFAAGWSRRVTPAQTARWIDDQQGLQERLSTAWEMSDAALPEDWKRLVIEDAARRAGEVDTRRLLPFGFPRLARGCALVLALAAGLGFVPEYRTKKFQEVKRDGEVIQDTGRQLAVLTRRSLETRPPALEENRQALEAVAELGDHLARAQLTRTEALKDISSVTEKLKDQVRELGRNPALKSMEKAARSSTDRGGTQSPADLQKKLDELQQALENQPKDADAMEKFKQKVEQAAQMAANLPDKDSPASAEAMEKMAQTLSDLSRQAMEMGLSLPALEEAMAALAASQTDQLVRDLKSALTDLEKLQATAKALAELQARADKMGQDLAEQLEFGQVEAARSRLAEMIEQLKSGVDEHQMKRLLEEISRAIHPAGQYARAADKLKEAESQMKTGDKAAASESLQAAANELKDLMQQMADAQSMMASLESLQSAAMAIANGNAWQPGARPGRPRAGPGNEVGAGVGTWGDDSRLMDISDIRDRWDNSGVVRPDEEARGLTDRGDPQMADNFAPTKVKGQIDPKGPMPSITLKGVSIKGMSRVQIEEATAAAQSSAQAALSQEQVPRAYRGAVRDYFDDLKN